MRKIILYIILILIIIPLIFPDNLYAKNVLELELEAAVALAIETSESLKIKEYNSEIRRQQIKDAKSSIYPQVENVTSWSSNFDYPNTGLIDDYDVSSGITVDQLLFAFGRVSSAVKGAEKYLNISIYNREAEKRDIRYNAKVAYYAALLAKKTHMIVTQSYENAVTNKKILEDRSATGRVSKKDNIKISSDIATRQPIMYNALVTLKTSMNTLSRIIGVRDKDIVLTSDFVGDQLEVDSEMFKESLLSDEPALRALEEIVRLNNDRYRDRNKLNRAGCNIQSNACPLIARIAVGAIASKALFHQVH